MIKYKEAKEMFFRDEPDKLIYEDRKFKCLILRCKQENSDFNALHLCGYMAVPMNHPWYGKDYDSIEADVHGGLTWASNHFPVKEEDGSIESIWVVGFDCAHLGDISPGYDRPSMDGYTTTYKNIEYVKKELKGLVDQAIQIMEDSK